MSKANAATVTNSIVVGGVVLGALILTPRVYASLRKSSGAGGASGSSAKSSNPFSDLFGKILPKSSAPAPGSGAKSSGSGAAGGAPKPPSPDGGGLLGKVSSALSVDTSISPSDLRPYDYTPLVAPTTDFSGLLAADQGPGTLADSYNSILNSIGETLPSFSPDVPTIDSPIDGFIDYPSVDVSLIGSSSNDYLDAFTPDVLPPDDSTDSSSASDTPSYLPYNLGDFTQYDGGDYWNDGGWDDSWNDQYGAYY